MKEWGKNARGVEGSNAKVWSLRERDGKKINQYNSGEN
jgi:hypothetical protein